MKNLLTAFAVIIFSLGLNAQEIDITGKNISIANGATGTTRNNNTDFGEQISASGSISKTFSITNSGTSNLSVSSITSNNADFTISGFTSGTIGPGGVEDFTVIFNPSSNATITGSITVNNNDANEGTYVYRVTGLGLASRTVRWVNNQGATRPASVTLSGDSYSTAPATYSTIALAIAAAAAYDIIYVTDGRYKNPSEPSSSNCNIGNNSIQDGNLYINVNKSNLIISSETGDYNTSSARVVGYSFNLTNTSGNITIQGLQVDSVRQNAIYNTDISTGPTPNVRILNNKFSNIRGHGIKTDTRYFNTIDRGAWEINGNYFENIGFYQSGTCTGTLNSSAMWLGEAGSSYEIKDNTIINPKWAGILCDGFGNPNGSANGALTISGNKISNTGNAGIQIGWSSTTNPSLQTPNRAFIVNNALVNVNTSSATSVGAITMLQSNLLGVRITSNQVTSSWNGLVINIAGWVNRGDTAECRFNNFCNIKSGSYALVHQSGVSPNVLGNVSDNLFLYKFAYNYYGASSGPTYSTNFTGSGAALFRSATTTSSGAFYSLNTFSTTNISPFRTSPNVIPVTNAGPISGTATPCAGSTQIYSITAVGGATSYVWSIPSGWSGTSTTNSISVTTNTASGVVSVYAVNACTSTPATSLVITTGAAPAAPGSIGGNGTFCLNVGKTLSVAAVSGATSYVWTVPSGFSGSSSTNSILVTPTLNVAFGSITVAAVNGCGTSSNNTAFLVTSANPTITASSGTICSGDSFTISPGGASTYTYSSGSSVVSPTATTNYSITGRNGFGCLSTNTAVITVSVLSTPTISVNSGSICSGKSFTMVPSGASTYTFSSGSAIVSPTINTSYSVVGTSTGGCESANTAVSNVTVATSPTITVNSGGICSGNSFTISPSGANTYTISGGSAVVSPTIATSYSVTGTATNGCLGTNTAVASVTINAKPTITVNSGGICSGNSFTINPGGASTYTISGGSSIVSPTTTTSYSVTGTGTNGCISSNTAVSTVSINASPTITINSGSICSGNSFTLIPGGADTYTISGGSTVVSPTVITSYSVTGTGTNGCISSNTAISSVNVGTTPTISVNSGSICSGNSFTIVPSGANTYTISGGSSIVTPTTNTSYTITGTGTNGCVGGNTALATVSIEATPTISVNSGGICSGNSFTIIPTGANTYTISGGSSIVSPTISTSYSITGTATNGCVGSNTAISSVSINASPTITVNSGGICISDSFTIVPVGANTYTFSSGSAIVSPTSNTSYSVTGTGTNGCISSNTAISNVSINPSPTISVNSGSICSGTSFTILPSGAGTYTITGGSSVVSPTVNTSYTVIGTGTNGCVSSNTVISAITVVDSPTISATSGTICSGNSFTIDLTGASTYTISGGSTVVSPTVTANYSITGTGTNGCVSSNTAVSTVNVNASPTIAVNSGSICSGNSFTITPSGASTYTYSGGSSIVSPATNTSVNVTGTGTNGCVSSNTAISNVTVNASPTISVNSGSICSGNSFTMIPSGASTYTFSNGSAITTPTSNVSYSVTATSSLGCISTNTAISSVTVNITPTLSVNSGSICTGESFTINPSGANTYTYSGGSAMITPSITTNFTVTGTSAQGCTAIPVVSGVTVHSTPILSVNSGSICAGQSFTLSPSGGSTYTVSGGLTIVSPTINTSYTITGTSAQGCVASNTAISSVVVNTVPIISVNSGTICNGTAFTLTPSGAASYTYQGGSSVVSPSVTSSFTVSGTSPQGCVSATTAVSGVTVFALPTLSLSGGSICPGNNFTLNPSGAATYTYLNGGPVITPTITGTYSVTGTSAEGCPGANTITAVVTVTNTLIVTITGSTTICSGQEATLTANGAATYSWTNGITTATVALSPSVNTTYTVYGVSGTCSNNAVVSVSVNTTPTITIAGSNTLCSGNSISLTASGANSYSWNTSAITASINVSPTVGITYSVVGTSTNSCFASTNQAVSVFSVPVITVNSGSICSGESFTINPSGANTYTYSGGAIITPTITTNYTITGTSAQGCTAVPVISSVTVNSTPTLAINSGSICSGQSFTLSPSGASTYTVTGGLTIVSPTINTSYSVTGTSAQGCLASNTAVSSVVVNTLPIVSVNSGSICNGTSFTITPSGAASYTYQGGSAIVSPTTTSSFTVSGTSPQGCVGSTTAVSDVTVFALPTLSLSGGSICPGNNFTLNPTGASTYTYLNGGPFLTPSVTASYSVTGTSPEGCPASNTVVAVVTVTNTLLVGITGSAVICSGQEATLTANGASTYSWSTGITTASIVLSPSVNTTYTVYGVSGTCSNNAVVTLTVNTTPTITIAGTNTLCSGNSISLTASGANSYSWSTSASTSSISVSPTTNISYSVVGTTTDACSASATQAVSVFSVPVLSVNGGSICSGNSFTINASGANTYTYSGGGTVVSPGATTAYTVTGTSLDGCVASPVVSNVTVNTTPTVSVGNGTICSGQSFTINPLGASSYTISGGLSVVSPTSNVSYSITGTSLEGCVASNTAVSAITVNTLPIIAVNSGSICNGTSFTLTPSGAASYTYQSGSAVVSPTTNSSFTVSGTSPQGCVSASIAVSNVTVFALPTLSLSGGSICPGNNFTLNPTGASTYTYLNGGPVITPSATTSYSVTGTSPEGCPAGNTVVAVVTVTNTLSVGITGTAVICSGKEATLIANGASTYSWSTGVLTASIALSPSVNTTYTVYGVSGTCSNNAVVTLTVNTTPTITIAGTNTLCSGNSISLTASGANSYSWSTNAVTSSISVSPTTNITYSVIGTTTDACSSSATQAISVFTIPVVSVNNGSICSGNSFTILPSGASTYTFSSGSAIVSPSVTSNYSVTGTSAVGCISTITAVSNVTVNATPTIAVTNGTICVGDTFTLNPSGAATYVYSGGGATVSPSVNTSYSITGSSSVGCVSSNTAVSAITVNTLPIIVVNSGSICAGNSFTIAPSGAASYTVSGGIFVVSPATNTNYSVTGTGTNGCVNLVGSVSQLTVNALPTLSLSGGSICPGNSFTFSPAGAATYTYLNGGPVVTPAVTTSYSVTGTSAAGCAATNTIVAVVTVTNTLALGVTGSTIICSGQSATLTGTGATTYSWSNGPTTTTVSLNPLTNSTYTLYGVSGTCSNNLIVTVSVNITPTISIAGSNTVCSGSQVSYTASGANTYVWNTTATTTVISDSPVVNTNYSVTGTATNGCINVGTVSASVIALPLLTVNSGSICTGQVFTMTPGGANTYTFTNGSSTVSPLVTSLYTVTGTSTAGCIGSPVVSSVIVNVSPTITVNSGSICAGQSFVIVPNGASNYSYSGGSATVSPIITTVYSVTGTSSLGCASSNTAISTVTVIANPVLTVTASSSSLCAGNSGTLSVSGAENYTWSVNGSNTTSIVVTPTSLTNYTVLGTNTSGCSNSTTIAINLFTSPVLTIASTNSAVCAGFGTTLTAYGASSYSWNTGSNTSVIFVSPTVTSIFSVTGTDQNGCVASSTIAVALIPVPGVSIVTSAPGVCTGSSVGLTAIGASSYSWNTGALTSTVSVSPSVTTVYTVTGTSGAGCFANASATILTYPNPTINIGPDVEVGIGKELQLNPTHSLAATYSWSPTDYLSSTNVINPVSTPYGDITYTLLVTSSNGCIAKDTMNVKVLTKLIIANYMSPNNDGKNDFWKVNLPALIKNYSILIIDSYNQTVYTKTDSYNNEFDGKRNGDVLPDGVYYYFIKDGNTVKYKGSITITK